MHLDRLQRRDLIALFGGMASARPLALRAQQTEAPVIGLLGSESPGLWADRLQAFHRGLGETGYVDGQNVTIEYRWAASRNDLLPGLAADLVRRRVAVIAAPGSTPAALAAKAATSTIPIVFWIGGDPIELRLVGSMNRPEGNLTGVTTLNHGLVAKRMELLHEVAPATGSIAVLINPTSPALSRITLEEAQTTADSRGLKLQVLEASDDRGLEKVFADFVQLRAGGLVLGTDAFFSSRLERLAALSLRYAVPTAYQFREFAVAGGLIGYGGSLAEAFRGTGVYTGRILKGAKPADLPVQRVTKLELYLNLQTARTLGLHLPLHLVARANEVVE